jgi:ubiquinone/menaquinone biosynthesis C-methylase UbiE
MKRIVDYIDPLNISTILDIGTGNGDFIDTLSELFQEALITGVDPSEEALTEARKRFVNPRFSLHQMEAEHLQFNDNRFDLCTLSNALHHLEHPGNSLREMKRVTKAGGWIMISEIISDGLNEAQENQKLYHHHRSYVDRLNGISHRETYSKSELLEMLKTNLSVPDFTFEYLRKPLPEKDPEKLNEWIRKMELHQMKVVNLSDIEKLTEWIGLFKERVLKYGFQPATNLVVGIRNRK